MNDSVTVARPLDAAIDLRPLRLMLVLQIAVGLLWGVSMLVFARQIVAGDASGAHIEKIAMEGAAHLALVFGAVLVWRNPYGARDALRLLIVLNALWVLTDLIYIWAAPLSGPDVVIKTLVNAAMAIGLAIGGRRAQVL